mmetsp:Transcript_10835/g.21774  ORF Transcript_10835/g.21774 Transcript_10835/m.21774 type:complete len:207 (-) Transcript_10835:238-858(-)
MRVVLRHVFLEAAEEVLERRHQLPVRRSFVLLEDLAAVDGDGVEHIADVLPRVRRRHPPERRHRPGDHGGVLAQLACALVDLVDAREGLHGALEEQHELVLVLRLPLLRHLGEHLALGAEGLHHVRPLLLHVAADGVDGVEEGHQQLPDQRLVLCDDGVEARGGEVLAQLLLLLVLLVRSRCILIVPDEIVSRVLQIKLVVYCFHL